MSIEVMNLVWRSTLEGSSRRFVLLALADRADDDGYCWPGVQNLVDKTGLSESTVHRALKGLEADRLLLHEARWTPQGDRDTNAYWINIEALAAIQRPRVSERGKHPMAAQEQPVEGWVHCDTTPCHGEPTGGVVVTPNTPPESAGSPQEEDQDQKHSASAASRQAATAQQQPKFDPPFDPDTDDPHEWIEEQLDGGYGPGEEAMVFDMLDCREYHPYRIVNTIKALRYGSSDQSTYRKGRTDVLDWIGEQIGGYRDKDESDLAADLLLRRMNRDNIVGEVLAWRKHAA